MSAGPVAVLSGGRSMEREVSLRSGVNVVASLRRGGHEVLSIDPDERLVATLRAERPRAAFVALHGSGGEDGTVQELLEILEIPYTGSGVLACQRSWDKVRSKSIFAADGIPTPEWTAFSQQAFRELGAAEALPDIVDKIGLPLVVKPSRQGSALGIGVAREPGQVASALMSALSYDDHVLLERWVAGRELAVTVIGHADEATTLPVVEAVPKGRDFYDFEARYTPGLTELHAPADIPAGTASEAASIALACHRSLGCRGFSRVDLLLDADDELWVLEVNAIPGMTDTSLLPKAAEAAGYGFDEVVERVLADAVLGL
ncbi:MAG: D-alanine--D-alanine ligase [Miltoncostaeaceae bacterium]